MIELEITWQRVLRVWWSYLWRSLLAMIVAMIAGGIFGFVMGFILSIMGVPLEVIKVVSAPIGFVIGLGISVFPLWMILGKDFGSFRLILVSKETEAAATPAPTPSV